MFRGGLKEGTQDEGSRRSMSVGRDAKPFWVACIRLGWLNHNRYYWGQSAHTHVPTRVVDTATLTQQSLTRLNLGLRASRLHSVIVAHARIWLPQAAHAVAQTAQSHTRGPGSGPLFI